MLRQLSILSDSVLSTRATRRLGQPWPAAAQPPQRPSRGPPRRPLLHPALRRRFRRPPSPSGCSHRRALHRLRLQHPGPPPRNSTPLQVQPGAAAELGRLRPSSAIGWRPQQARLLPAPSAVAESKPRASVFEPTPLGRLSRAGPGTGCLTRTAVAILCALSPGLPVLGVGNSQARVTVQQYPSYYQLSRPWCRPRPSC